jgi:hypothetical protein
MTCRGHTHQCTLAIRHNTRPQENDRVKYITGVSQSSIAFTPNEDNLLWESYIQINLLLGNHVFKQIFFIQEEEDRRILEDIFPVGCVVHR